MLKRKNKTRVTSLRLGENAKRQRLDKSGVIYQKKNAVVKASYEIALLVAKSMKAHTIGESLSGNASSKDFG